MLNRTMHFEMESENETLRSTVKTMEQALTDYKLKFEYAQKEINSLNNQLKISKQSQHSQQGTTGTSFMSSLSSSEDQMVIKQLEMRLAEARRTNEKLVLEVADLKSENESLKREMEMLRINGGPSKLK
jgi:hypothetical protein